MSQPIPAPPQRAAPRPGTTLRVGFDGAGEAPLAFAFADGAPWSVRIPCDRLAGPTEPEAWHFGDAFRAVVVEQADRDDITDAARQAYASLLARVRGSSHPYLLRIWNYCDAINVGDGDGERYRRFCVGRAAAVGAAFNDPPPAATAIGHDRDTSTLQVIALCGRDPAIALENPRQTPAWRYPRAYGPAAPGFSRGAVLGAGGDAPRLLASGTASIVGHLSEHVGDVEGQLRESLRNLEALLEVGAERSGHAFGLASCEALRVYLRDAADLAIAQEVVGAAGISAERVLYVRGDVCRRELDVELEGVFAPGSSLR